MMDIHNTITENIARNASLDEYYNPITGEGSPVKRQEVKFSDLGSSMYLPLSMLNVPWVNFVAGYRSLHDSSKDLGTTTENLMFELSNERFKHDFEFWAATTAKIKPKTGGDFIPFILNKPQRKMHKITQDQIDNNEPIRQVLLKSRQFGGSTYYDIFGGYIQTNQKTNWNSLIAAHLNQAATNIRFMFTTLAKHYPKGLPSSFTIKGFENTQNIKILPERNCKITVGSIETPDSIRADDVAIAHLCICPDTEIPLKNGFTKKAKDVQIGDSIITHTGKLTRVSCVTISKPEERNGNGKAIIIKPWGQQPICLTPNHPVFTQRGWVNADDLTKKDLVSYPVREITNGTKYIQLPVYEKKRKQGGGTIPSGSGKKLYLDKEVGYAFGYYLAEGSVHVKGNTINEVTFSRDKDDFKLSERAIKALSCISIKVRTNKSKTSRTEHDIISDSVLAKWLFENIGMKENKTIPDWFFDCGSEFLSGVLTGYLSGDGSRANGKQGQYVLAAMTANTISSSIAFQIRDIAISLGFGIASVDIKKSGVLYGRNCKKAYVLRWAGSSARRIRKEIGLEVPYNGHSFSEKSFIENGFVWIKVKDISHSGIEQVVDIEVEHSDHSFRTISLSVKNSEVGLWKKTDGKSPQDLCQSILGTIPTVPWSMYVLESTAKGVGNFFHRTWQKAVKGENGLTPVFIPWLEDPKNRIAFKNKEEMISLIKTLNPYELFLWEAGATLEGINFYRFKLKEMNGDEWAMKSEFPTTADESFQSTGQKVFAPSYVKAVEKDCIDPEFKGDVFADAQRGKTALRNLKFEPTKDGKLWVWSLPDFSEKISHRYCGFADIGGRSKDADYSVLKIFDRYWMLDGGGPEVVAVWHGHLDQDLFAWKCAQICQMYDNALLAIETNSLKKEETEGDHFLTILDEIAPHYNNLYIRNDFEKFGDGFIPKYGFQTNAKTKGLIINSLNAASRERMNFRRGRKEGYDYIERDQRAVDEMSWYEVKANGTMGAVEGEHDDHVIVTAGGVWLATSYMPKPERIITVTQNRRRNLRSEASF